ncbi:MULTISPECIES: YopX family protein [Bhargavaea]|uniref:YopX family protein n=1 Tax=Bhargavaea changchunensis TaxID=2134037 RepID=A0ABW2NF23_9BACL|nr:YopX family protein [Bhargavaea sp. CC-171006]
MRAIKFSAIYKPTGEHFVPWKIDFNNQSVVGSFDGQEGDWCNFSLDGNRGDAILRQFTGLHDKKEREIYEGDVLHCFGSFGTKHKYEVKFGLYEQDGSGGEYGPSICLGVYAESLEKDKRNEYGSLVIHEEDHTKSLLEFEEYEVIGNIHENPELLNG